MDIYLDVPINAAPARVFAAISTPAGLDAWWTKSSAGSSEPGSVLQLGFGAGYDWRARIVRCEPPLEFELEMIEADADWIGTRVRFSVESRGGRSWIRFQHSGWPAVNEHYRISCSCWALYLRILRRWLEFGESVPYERRLDV